jgi:putative FmdB family regulatory protein
LDPEVRMPIYEYECGKCSTRFDFRRGFNDSTEPSCPVCNGEARRLFSPVGIVFKGPGFYVTDSRSDRHGEVGSGGDGEDGSGAEA